MSEGNKTISIVFLGFILLINVTMATWAFTRRSADDSAKIEKARWDVKREKLDQAIIACKESGGIADVNGDYLDCKKPN